MFHKIQTHLPKLSVSQKDGYMSHPSAFRILFYFLKIKINLNVSHGEKCVLSLCPNCSHTRNICLYVWLIAAHNDKFNAVHWNKVDDASR